MKKLIIIAIAAILFGCTQEPTEKQVVFSTNYLTVNSGNLKSFDINDWRHYYWPYEVTVELTGQTGVTYTTFASNSFQFFKHGTEPMHLPFGEYTCTVTGGGWKQGGNAFSYFVWSIKDTVIQVTEQTDVIRFELENTPALIVKDAEVPIDITAAGLDAILWTGRGANDFVYVTAPWDYTASYNGNFAPIEAEQGKYYYLQIATDTVPIGGVVELPVFEGDTISL